jgi:hypothetical protein
MKINFVSTWLCVFCAAVWVYAQPYSSNVFLFDTQIENGTLWHFSKPRILTSDNAARYNNQPAFWDGVWYISSAIDTLQTDIVALDIDHVRRTNITKTDTVSEFSPTLHPSRNYMTYITLEPNAAQRLWQYSLYDKKEKPKPIFEDVTNIGYHTWLNDTLVAVYLLEAGNDALYVANTVTKEMKLLFVKAGRCFKMSPDGTLYFVDKLEDDRWYIKSYSPQTGNTHTLTITIDGAEDFAITENGIILMAGKSKLYQFNPYRDMLWREVADFASYGLHNIKRIALRGNEQIALVNE